jgi:MFS family permease
MAGPSLTELSPARRYLVLAICCLSLFIVGIDVTIVNVALPAIQRSLHASVSGLQWTVDAYTLVIACLLMLSGSLADRFGRRRVFQIGLAIFSLGSLLCGVAPGPSSGSTSPSASPRSPRPSASCPSRRRRRPAGSIPPRRS